MSGLASMAAQGLAASGAGHARVLAAADPTLASFYHQPWWLVVIKVLFVFLFLMIMTLFAIWAERRIIGRMQQRPGPNRAGPFGLLQSLLDGIKLPLKEDIVPTQRGQAAVLAGPGDRRDPRVHQLRDHPVRPRGLDLRRADPAAAGRPARWPCCWCWP